MKPHIPNVLTCLNLFSGCVGVVFALQGRFEVAAYCLVVSGVCDFLDGLVARALGVKSAMGKELDSLADVVSFGFLPGAIFHLLLRTAFPGNGLLPFLGFTVTVFSAIRLAKFNLDDRQTHDFIGLNTPMNAFYVMSLPFIAESYGQVIYHPAFLVCSVLINSLLLVSNIRLFSMKSESWSWNSNRWKYLFLISSTVLVVWLGFAATPAILVLYFLCSYIHFQALRPRY